MGVKGKKTTTHMIKLTQAEIEEIIIAYFVGLKEVPAGLSSGCVEILCEPDGASVCGCDISWEEASVCESE